MIRATFIKELQLFLRDRAGLITTFLMPAAFIAGFGLMFKGAGSPGPGGEAEDAEPIVIAVWHEPDHEEAKQAVAWIRRSGPLQVIQGTSAESVRAGVTEKKWRAGLIFPPDFKKDESPAELTMDLAVQSYERMMVEGPLKGAFLAHETARLFPRVSPKALTSDNSWESRSSGYFTPKSPPGVKRAVDNLDSFQVSVPGNTVLFCFFLSLGVAMSFYEERKRGTWRRLLAAPGPRVMLLIGKLLPFAFIGCLQVAVLFAFGHLVFGMRIGGSVLALGVITVCVVYAATSLGLLIAAFGGTEKQISGYSLILILGMALLGGCMFPRMFMPQGLQAVGNCVPHGWALDAYYTVLVRTGSTLADVALPCLAIAGFGMLFMIVASLVFRFER